MHADLITTLKFLNNFIPHKNWFIAGGSAASETFNDIDVYFTSMADYHAAASLVTTTVTATANAMTFRLAVDDNKHRHIQFIHRTTGDHITVVESFDLNKSRQVIFPDGTRYAHPSAQLPLHFTLDTFNTQTISRFHKYVFDKGFPVSPIVYPIFTELLTKDLVDVEDYYDGSSRTFQIFPTSQFRNYNQSLSTLKLVIECVETLPPNLRLKRYAYLFKTWCDAPPPVFDILSPEYLYVYSKTYGFPMHQRVIDECPEYLV